MLADFVAAHRKDLITRWKQDVGKNLGLELVDSELVDDLPNFIDDLVVALKNPAGHWPEMDGVKLHGRQRVELGMDIACMTEEMAMVEESIVGLAREKGLQLDTAELQQLNRVTGHATALAVQSYFELQDKQRTDEMADHYAFIAHQLRNPLNSAALIAEILTMVPEDQRAGHIARLRRSLTRLAKLVDDSLIDARLRSNPELDLQWVAATDLIDEAYNEVAFHAEEREIVLERHLEDLQWQVDPKLMTSALTNLLSTAIKFSCRGGHIQLRLRQDQERFCFVVEDECGGLPEDFQLFAPVRKKEYRTGFGLGLSLVKQVVEAHHGTIAVDNRPGQGCKFVVEIPRGQDLH